MDDTKGKENEEEREEDEERKEEEEEESKEEKNKKYEWFKLYAQIFRDALFYYKKTHDITKHDLKELESIILDQRKYIGVRCVNDITRRLQTYTMVCGVIPRDIAVGLYAIPEDMFTSQELNNPAKYTQEMMNICQETRIIYELLHEQPIIE